MKRVYSRLIALALSAVLILSLIPPVSAAADDLHSTVDRQVRAYCKSINQSDADTKAAAAMASHGILKGGQKLIAGTTHSLTATLMNSAML